MASFTDMSGQRWLIQCTVALLKRVRAAAGVNLLELVEPDSPVLKRLAMDPVELFEVLCAVVRPQLVERGLSDVDFGELLDEAASDAAVTALMEAVIDFFPDRKRALLKSAFGKATAVHSRISREMIDKAERLIEGPDAEKLIEAALRKELGISSGNSPASSAAIPAA